MRFSTITKAVVVAVAAVVAVAPSAVAYDLTGAGATSISNFLEKCKTSYQGGTGDTISYSGGGSGTGKTAINAGIKDVGFSDSTNTAAPATVIHIPAAVWPVGIGYNLNTPRSKPLQFSVETLAKIFSGQITRWNDPAIVADNNRTVRSVVYRKDANGNARLDSKGNPIVLRNSSKSIFYTLPAKPIKVVFRSDTSGTTNNFTRWMSGNAPTVWTKPANDAFTTAFPGNINATSNIGRIVGANGSQGVATLASKTPYSITYAEKQWGTSFGLRAAYVGNASGNFTLPDSAAVSAFLGEAKQAADGIVTYDYATKVPGAYTLGIVSYMLLETSYANKEKGKAVVELAEYLLSPECSLGAASTGFIVIEGTFLAKAKQLIARANK